MTDLQPFFDTISKLTEVAFFVFNVFPKRGGSKFKWRQPLRRFEFTIFSD